MTTKQAADIIRMLLGYLKGEIEPPKQETIEEAKAFEQQGYECLEMAIKALEQQPCEDAISRKDMLAIFRQSNSLSQAWDGFEKLSSVTLKEKSEYEHDHEVVKAYNDGQAYILDKIRAEIEEMKLDVDLDIGNEMIYNNAIKDVLEIIDKYRGE